MGTKKSAKGKVVVYDRNGYLWLRWRFNGDRYSLSTGLISSDPISQGLAQNLANTIYLHTLSGQFIPTDAPPNYDPLAKYKPKKAEQPTALTPSDIFANFLENGKSKEVTPRTLANYKSFAKELEGGITPDNIMLKLNTNCPHTILRKLNWLVQAYKFAGIPNPFEDVIKRHKVPPKLQAKPFTSDEVAKILDGFAKMYPHYLPYVQFCLSTGVRLQEANALKWDQINEDLNHVHILDFKRKTTRSFRLPPMAIAALTEVKSRPINPNGFVFTAILGGKVLPQIFRQRYWKKVLEAQGIDYRRPYLCRSTAISHALGKGANPLLMSQLTGHDVQTLYKSYAGFIESSPVFPELFKPIAEVLPET